MPYAVNIEKSALKVLKKLPRNFIAMIWKEIVSLERNPRPSGHKKLKGHQSLYRIRCGNYRIIYEIQDKVLVVLVIRIGDRKEVYRKIPGVH
jgi:mRNA interferase RelE/StbE